MNFLRKALNFLTGNQEVVNSVIIVSDVSYWKYKLTDCIILVKTNDTKLRNKLIKLYEDKEAGTMALEYDEKLEKTLFQAYAQKSQFSWFIDETKKYVFLLLLGLASVLSAYPMTRILPKITAEVKAPTIEKEWVTPADIREELHRQGMFNERLINIFIQIARRESTFHVTAFRDKKDNPGGGNDHGLFQINDKWHPYIFENPHDFTTLKGNVKALLTVYHKYGLKPWRSQTKPIKGIDNNLNNK